MFIFINLYTSIISIKNRNTSTRISLVKHFGFQRYEDLSGDPDLNNDENNPPPAKKEKVADDHKVNLCPIINPIQKVISIKDLRALLFTFSLYNVVVKDIYSLFELFYLFRQQ